MSITSCEIWKITFFHLIFLSPGDKEKLTGERVLLTSSTQPLLPQSGKDITASDDGDEKTEVWYGIEYTINKTLQTLSQVKYRFDNCGDVRHPSIIVTTEPIKKGFIDVKNKGVKTRFITEITKIIYIIVSSLCKLLVRFDILMELREISQ
jgi:hypothetical protein